MLTPAGNLLASLQQQLNHSQWWPPEQIARYQTRQLALLLRHARAHVPFYRDRTAYQSNNSWQKLPVLSRSDVQEYGDQLHSEHVPPAHGAVTAGSTSGSTGTPLSVRITELQWQLTGALSLRANTWHGRDPGKRLAGIDLPHGAPTQYPGHVQNGWGWPTDLLYSSGAAAFLDKQTPFAQQIEWLQSTAPNYLVAWPSTLTGLLDICQEEGIRFKGLEQVATLGELVDDDLREQCKTVWGVPVYDVYSAREASTIAVECRDGGGYHVMAETVKVEILHEDGRTCAPGETGRIVVTPLHAYAMPLLRYDIGDYAEVGAPCSCGRGLPVLRRVIGRTRNLFRLPSGERFSAYFKRQVFTRIAPIRQHQFVQTGPDTIQARLVVARPITRKEEKALLKVLHDALGHPFHIHLQYLESIPRGPGGKYEYYRCDWDGS